MYCANHARMYWLDTRVSLLQALSVHQDSAQEGTAEAHDAVLVTLQCLQALTSGRGGMDAAIAAPGFVPQLCTILDPHDQDCCKLVVAMLTKLCLYSVESYCAALEVSSCRYVCEDEMGTVHGT